MAARRLQVHWFPLASIGAVVGAALLLDLPERGALVRSPDYGFQIGRYGTTSFVVWSVAALTLAWALQAATDRPRRPSPVSHLSYYVAFGVLYADLVFLGGSHGESAGTAGWSLWAFAGVVPAVWLGRHVASRLEDARARAEGPWDTGAVRRPPLRLGAGEKALWVGRRNGWGYRVMVYVMPLGTAGAVVFAANTARGPVAVALHCAFFVGIFVLGFLSCRVQVTVREQEVRVEAGPARIPLWRMPVADLVEARVEDVRPFAYGGYGYHAKGGRRCLIVRAGPGLLLRRRSGRDVLVTVNGADEGAALLNALIEQQAPAEARAVTR